MISSGAKSFQYSLGNSDGSEIGGYIVDSYHVCAGVYGGAAGGDSAFQSFLRRKSAEGLTDDGLAGSSQQHRIAVGGEACQVTHESEVLLGILGEADARIKDDFVLAYPSLR